MADKKKLQFEKLKEPVYAEGHKPLKYEKITKRKPSGKKKPVSSIAELRKMAKERGDGS